MFEFNLFLLFFKIFVIMEIYFEEFWVIWFSIVMMLLRRVIGLFVDINEVRKDLF